MMISKRMLSTVLVFCALIGFGPRAWAATARGGATPPRLGFINGEVSFWRTGAADWSQAQVNTALAAGDALYAGDGANLELQIGPRAFVRAGANTEIDLTALDPGYLQFRITGGHAAADFKRLPGGQTVEIDTPNAAFTINRPGYYRVDVDENTTAFSARQGGAAMVAPAAGESAIVGDNQQIVLSGTDTVQVNVDAAPPLDEWDQWNAQRTAQFGEAPRSAQYVPPEVAGVDDLDRAGDWQEQPNYGNVWVPRDVGPEWAPYTTGRWVYDPMYQWTWVDDSPWGWAPYHYGRWVHFGSVWGWAPGPVVVAPVYSPALVAFFGAPGVGVSVGIGVPFVSWCALGWGEPIVPWWGGHGFAGRPYWGGWGGPRVVNNVVINNTRVVNVTNINNYQNVNVRNAMVGVDRNQFGRGRVDHVHLDAQQVHQLRPMRGDLRVRPVAASLAPREARGARPPQQLQTRQVVATRPPQDPTARLRAQGVTTSPVARRPEPRIVRAPRGPAPAAAQPPVGGSAPGIAGHQAPPVSGGQPSVGAAPVRPGPPPHTQRSQPGAPGHAMPPPPPHAAPAGQAPSGGAPVPPPPPRAGERHQPARQNGAGQAVPAPPPMHEPPAGAPVHPAPSTRLEHPVPQNHPAARPAEPAIPHPQSAPREHVAPPPPAHPQAPAVQERSAPPAPVHPPAPAVHERPAPAPVHPQAPPQERPAPQAPVHQPAPPREQHAPRPAPAPQQQVAPPPAAHMHPAPPEKREPHDAPQQGH